MQIVYMMIKSGLHFSSIFRVVSDIVFCELMVFILLMSHCNGEASISFALKTTFMTLIVNEMNKSLHKNLLLFVFLKYLADLEIVDIS